MKEFLTEVGEAKIITPDCNRTDCVIIEENSTTTLIGLTPTYDKWGNVLNKNLNTTTSQMKCLKCDKQWVRTK